MSINPFYFVTLTHSTWEKALAFAKNLPSEAMAELRLDLFPNQNPEEMITALHGRCLVSCRKTEDGGKWQGDEDERIRHILSGMPSQPAWVDLEWDVDTQSFYNKHTNQTRLLRSIHVRDEIFDLEWRINNLPKGDAFKWVGKANSLVDNLRLKNPLGIAKSLGLTISAFLMGPKGVVSRCMQAAWGGSFTYAHPDDAPPISPGQLALGKMMSWQCHNIKPNCQLYGVIGKPILHSLGPDYHNQHFQKLSKNMIYLPFECHDPIEARNAIELLELLGVSITAPLKENLPIQLGLKGPINTLWHQPHNKKLWQGINTDYMALDAVLNDVTAGPVLILGDGGVAKTTQQVILDKEWPCLLQSRKNPISLDRIRSFKPVGIVQATCLGMYQDDPIPFPNTLTAAESSIQWGLEWVYKENTAFAKWIHNNKRHLISGTTLFELQAAKQSDIFLDSSR